jgi:hypothetical protein
VRSLIAVGWVDGRKPSIAFLLAALTKTCRIYDCDCGRDRSSWKLGSKHWRSSSRIAVISCLTSKLHVLISNALATGGSAQKFE